MEQGRISTDAKPRELAVPASVVQEGVQLDRERTGRRRATLTRPLSIGIEPDDDADARFKKRLQNTMAWASLPVMLGIGVLMLVLDRPTAALFPFAYVLITIALLAHAALTGRFEPFRSGHLWLVVVAPAAFHWYLGGFAASGGILLWGAIAPLAAVMFVRPRASGHVFAAFAIVTALAALREWPFVSTAPPLPAWVVSSLFVLNTMGLAAFAFASTRWFVSRLDQEKRRSEALLLNVLPAPIAQRLRREAGVIAERFEAVTVLFSDIVGFTALSAQTSPEDLVAMLDELFSEFDGLADRFGLEKIKTIGDAYMVVGGLPAPRADHVQAVASMGLAMVEVVRAFSQRRGGSSEGLDIRIGIHTGPVVAGVIGRRKFTYDLWGDTVNLASRMESHGEAGRVHCSEATAGILRQVAPTALLVRPRGPVEVKGKGTLSTFWIEAAPAAEGGTWAP